MTPTRPRRPAAPLRHPLTVQCDRCGQQQQVERASHFRESDYEELFRDFCELQMLHKATEQLMQTLLRQWLMAQGVDVAELLGDSVMPRPARTM